MSGGRKWAIAAPVAVLLAFGLPALAAGRLWWFVGDLGATLFVVLQLVMWLGATAIYRPTNDPQARTASRRLIGIGLIALTPVAVWDRTHDAARYRSIAWSATGLVLCLLGAAVGLAALRALGNAYASDPTVRPGQRLVTTGIYAQVRHPVYTALLTWAAGLALLLGSIWGMVVSWALLAPAVALRIREEESLLAHTFGAQYECYAARTHRLIPFVF